MGLGILEPKDHERVPGTTIYYDAAEQSIIAQTAIGLKTDAHRNIILVPQPSDDPNDPLNWPLWKRDLTTFVLCWAGILATSLGSVLAANTVTFIRIFHASITDAAVLTGYFLLGAGGAAIFFVPSARVWGKRHLFFLGLVLVVVSSAWGGAVGGNYRSMIGARVVQGIGASPYESLLNAAVGDLYFVHQRGIRMAFTNLAVFGSAFFTPVVVGKITERLGWEWSLYFIAIFSAATLPLVFFFCPETAYRRESRYNIDLASSSSSGGEESKLATGTQIADDDDNAVPHRPLGPSINGMILIPTSRQRQPIGHANTPKKTFMESLSLFDGTKTDDSYWVLLLRPFPLAANPAFIWASIIQGTMIGWTIFIGIVVASIFIGPPYWWGEVKAGYAYSAGFIGALLGFIISGAMADPVVRLLTRWNKGVYEPEFRLALVIPMLITGVIGLFGFAMTGGDVISGHFTFIIPLMFFAFEVCSMVIGTVASALYIVDAYRDVTVEGFTLMIIFKNFFSFILTFYAFEWLIISIPNTMLAVSGVQVGICLTTIPMYIYGKRVRAFYNRHDVFAPLNALEAAVTGGRSSKQPRASEQTA